MKKFYSIVLMATALLIGTNVKAADVTVNGNDLTALRTAITDAGSEGTVTLSQDIVITAGTGSYFVGIWIGTEAEDGDAQKITLDLAGHNISFTAGQPKQTMYPFVITKGELKIKSSSAAQISVEGANLAAGTNVFSVFGTYNAVDPQGANPFSHLEIGKNVTVQTQNGTVIAVDALRSGGVNTNNSTTYTSGKKTYNVTTTMPVFTTLASSSYYGKKPAYSTDYYKSTYGFAFGVLVDIEGKLISQGDDATKCYGIKTNGLLASPLSAPRNKSGVEIAARSGNLMYAWMSGYSIPGAEYAPYIHVHSGASIISSNSNLSDASAAVYCSGYAQWKIEGTCEGATGLYASSGDIDIADATIKSGATEYSEGTEAGHANGCGSAIVINSRNNYGGDLDVNISGDTKVEATAGFALEEIVNSTETKVESIAIEGGSFDGGAQGAITITEGTADADAIVITGGTYGNISADDIKIGQQSLEEFLQDNVDAGEAHLSFVDGNIVISEGAAPVGNAAVAGSSGSVNWKHLDSSVEDMAETLSQNLTLDELEINQNYNQTLTIAEGYSLTVGRVVMGSKAKIVVEAGAKLIVTGEQGIAAFVASNIVLKNEDGNRSIFLFHPNVTSNRHPSATIELLTNSWWEDAENLQWELIGLPTFGAVEDITCEETAAGTVYASVMVYENGAWNDLGYIGGTYSIDNSKLNNPFAAYDLIAYRDRDAEAPKIKVEGELVGNVDASLTADMKWSFFANSYTAEVDGAAFIDALTGVDDCVYLGTQSGNGSLAWNAFDAEEPLNIAPMQAFLLNNKGTVVVDNAIDYASMVYAPAIAAAAGAPRRYAPANDNTAKFHIVATNENGTWDNVKLRENANNVKAHEKFMNNDVNIYAMTDEKNAIVNAADLENTYVGFSTVKGGKFTISFANVDGREFELLDHATGARVAIAEGNTYEFTADANTVNDYRFEIVGRHNAPTAIDNTEAVKSAKGVYTITGQYLGEMSVWNALPAGVYVVNGEKRVK